MADNVVADAGSGGATFAADDIAGVHFPRSKLIHGADGVNDGDVSSANPLPVVQTGTHTVTANAGTNLNTSALATEAGGNLAAAATSLAILDDWDESDRAKVNLIAGQAGVQGASGAVTNLTQRVVLATDVALPAGTNNIGDVDVLTLPALVAGTANIGDVDVLTVPADPFGANADAASATGSISAKLRFIAATGIPITGTATTKETRSGTGTTSQVADSASSVTVLASNASRLGASVHNDSSAVLYLKCGTTASATDYTVRMVQYAYWEAPYGFTGRIDGIWATDPGDGAARVTEYT